MGPSTPTGSNGMGQRGGALALSSAGAAAAAATAMAARGGGGGGERGKKKKKKEEESTQMKKNMSGGGGGGNGSLTPVAVVQCGGTIDKQYPRTQGGYAFEFGDEPGTSRVFECTQLLGLIPSFYTVCRKDSQDMVDADRRKLAALCQETTERFILITHGTDTLIQTARFLEETLGRKCGGKVICLTGSMIPERFKGSDAMFNVGSAVGCLMTNALFREEREGGGGRGGGQEGEQGGGGSGGVFVCMNGRVFRGSKCQRNLENGHFESIIS